MKINGFLIFLLSIISNFCFAQNEIEFREAFTLKLPVDSTQFYQQEVNKSKYFVKDNILQIYPGEHLFLEAEVKGNDIQSMKVVKENKNPAKTIEIEFSQNVSGRKSEGMILKVSNPFNKKLNYNTMMYIVGRNEWIKTSIIPIQPKLKNFEMWNDVIISLVLNHWRLEE
ncbi:hypothetical protein CHRYSEOSP005_04670 [Chryseobacterium sp. Alg-005]|uniref:hypothetical protein n=1 Tax=Chryseobacterium sp. Alg-005 TaxID=3159516 RepID=UPI0035557778